MGANTFHSIGKPLPQRNNIVITHQNIDKVLIYKSIREFLIDYKNKKEEVFIIGGASIYKEFIDYASKLYLTEIDASDKEADTYFPEFDKSNYSKIILDKNEENGIKYLIHPPGSIFAGIKMRENHEDAFDNAIKRGMKNPENWMYMYSDKNKDFFKHIDTRQYISFPQFDKLELIKKKLHKDRSDR